MSWNYRIIKKQEEKPLYGIYEIYYSEGEYSWESEKFCSINEPVNISGKSLDDIRWLLAEMQKALEKPVIDGNTLKEIKSDI